MQVGKDFHQNSMHLAKSSIKRYVLFLNCFIRNISITKTENRQSDLFFVRQRMHIRHFQSSEITFASFFLNILRIFGMPAKYLRRFSEDWHMFAGTYARKYKDLKLMCVMGWMAKNLPIVRIIKESYRDVHIDKWTPNWDIAVASEIINLVQDNTIRITPTTLSLPISQGPCRISIPFETAGNYRDIRDVSKALNNVNKYYIIIYVDLCNNNFN